VGEGGFALGGGHGLITVKHGLAVDNILQARVVTPDGKLVTVNDQENTDLFWAIRGGGGGTFGVMIDLTIRAFPMESFTDYTLVLSAPFNYMKMHDVLAYIAYQFPRIAESNVMSYTSITPPVNDTQQWSISSLLGGLNYTAEEASAILGRQTPELQDSFKH
jgi:FAD/FMN-containing dehydrogenase